MRKPLFRLGCILLSAGMLASCSLLPAASPLPEPAPQEQPLYNASALDDGELRMLYPSSGGSTVLCGSTVLYQGRPSDSLALISDTLTRKTDYYLLAWSDPASPTGRYSALYDKTGALVLRFDREYNAFQTGDLLVLSTESYVFDTGAAPAQPGDCRVFDLSTGVEVPSPDNALSCVVAGDVLAFNCYDRPAEIADGEYDNDIFYHTSVALYDRSGTLLGTYPHTRAEDAGSLIPSEWLGLDSYPSSSSDSYTIDSALYNTLTGETLNGFQGACGDGVVTFQSEDGRIQLVDLASTDKPEVLCDFDSAVIYYVPGAAVLWAKDHSDYLYEFHDLTTGEVKTLYNADSGDTTLAIYATDGTLRVYDKTTGALLTDLTVEPVENQSSAQVSVEGKDYVTMTINRSTDLDYPLIRYYNADGLIRELDLKTFHQKYQSIRSLVFANGQPYFRASYDGPNGISLYDVMDIDGNVLISGLSTCYSYYSNSLHPLPEGVFVAQKGFYYGWMDLSGQWIYCQSIFSSTTDEDDFYAFY